MWERGIGRVWVIAGLVTVSLGCEPQWTLTYTDELLMERGSRSVTVIDLHVGGETVAAVLEDGGELTLRGDVDARYRYLLGPRAVIDASLGGPEVDVTLRETVEHRREGVLTFNAMDLLARGCSAACSEDTGDGTCDPPPCDLSWALELQRQDEPGQTKVWLDLTATLTPAAMMNPDFWWSVGTR